MPVVLETGEIVTIFLSIDLKESLPEGTQVEIKLKKEGFISLPIPCIDAGDGNMIGSCDYDVQAILDGLNELGGCPDDYLPEGQSCSLPMAPGSYGKFYAEIKFTTGGSTFACVWLRVKIA